MQYSPIERVLLLIGETGAGKSQFVNCLAKYPVAKVGNMSETGTSKVIVYKIEHEILSNIHVIDTIGFHSLDKNTDFESLQQILVFFFKNPKYKYAIHSIIYFEKAGSNKIRLNEYLECFCEFFKIKKGEVIGSFIHIITSCKRWIENGKNDEELQQKIDDIKKSYNIPIIEWESKKRTN